MTAIKVDLKKNMDHNSQIIYDLLVTFNLIDNVSKKQIKELKKIAPNIQYLIDEHLYNPAQLRLI